MYVGVCTRGQECTYACTFLSVRACPLVHVQVCAHALCAGVLCAGTHRCACLHLGVHSRTSRHVGASCAHADAFVWVCICVHTHIYEHPCNCVRVCMFVCIHARVHTVACIEFSFYEAMLIYTAFYTFHEHPWWLSGEDSTCQSSRRRFDPRVRRIPWRREWQPTAVFLPGKAHGQRSLVGLQSTGSQKSRTQLSDSVTRTHFMGQHCVSPPLRPAKMSHSPIAMQLVSSPCT